jgi:hypothetical protein
MQARNFRLLLGVALMAVASACSTSDNPYSSLKDPPLLQGRLLTVTLVSDTAQVEQAVEQVGFTRAAFQPNYPQADAVQASIWSVPEPVAAKASYFKSSKPGTPDVRVLVMPLAAKGRESSAEVDKAFFRNVLGSEVPTWPLPGSPAENVRIQVWGFVVPNILDAKNKLRDNGIPVIFDPVAITTPYLGDHKTLAIRAPDGTVVQLVETAAQ